MDSSSQYNTSLEIPGTNEQKTYRIKTELTNITEISGPTFTVDEPDQLEAQAKEKAIAEARDKARATAKALGMSLGEVVQYSEDGGGYTPMYARDAVSAQSYSKAGALGQEVTLPTGENKIKSRVTITYSLD